MRTIAPVMIVLAIGVAGVMIGMSGFGAAWGADSPTTSGAQEKLNESAKNQNPNKGPVSGPVSSGDSDIIGLIANGLGSMVDIASAVALLPVTLMNLGFPAYFAVPIGSLAYIIAGIGVIEYGTNREWT